MVAGGRGRGLNLTSPFGSFEKMKGQGPRVPFLWLFPSWGHHGIKGVNLAWKEISLETGSEVWTEMGIL